MLAFGQESVTLNAVCGLSSKIAAAAEEGEQNRHLSAKIVDDLRQAGVFRMMVPKKFGGDALSLSQVCSVLEELATADAAAAWTGMVAVGFNIVLASFPALTVEEVYADGPDATLRGAIAPIGKMAQVEGGYRVSGRWPFASGPYQPKWVVASGTVTNDGKPLIGPLGPETRVALVPVEKVEFLDTWYTVGLRGTDSRDFQMEDVFVPEEHAVSLFGLNAQSYGDPLFDLPFPLLAGPTHSAICVGIVRAVLADLTVLARAKRSAFNPGQTLGESQVFQHRLAEMSVRHAAIQSLLERQVREVTLLGEGTESMSMEDLQRHASYCGYIHEQAMSLVDEAFALAGSTPVYSKSTIQRRWRDLRVAAQHYAASTLHYPAYGALLMGIEPSLPGH